jgi:hypothetical protein
MAALRDLIAEKSRVFRSRFIGRTLSAVTIGDDAVNAGPGATTEAVTDNFLKLTLHSESDAALPANRLVTARITALWDDGLRGTPIP